MKYSVEEFANQIRKLYPGEYDDLSNEKLTALWLKKYPSDIEKVELNKSNNKSLNWIFYVAIVIGLIFVFIYKQPKNHTDLNQNKKESIQENSICSIHNKDCYKIAMDMGMNIVEYHKWQDEQQQAIQYEDENTDANGDIVNPNEDNTSSEIQNNTTEENSVNEIQEQWVNCKKCHGTGVRTCENCGGKGQGECENCDGNGWIGATSGAFTCSACNGGGIKSCSKCNGKGNRGNCSYCDGRGQVKE
jgi:DnaJ-class molecular chaperone